MSCNKHIIFSLVCKCLHGSNISISKTVLCSISCKSTTALISSEPAKSLVKCTPVCFSNVSIAKDFNSFSYWSVTCTEHLVNVTSSPVRKFIISSKTACPVDSC